MPYLLTGATGFLGQHLLAALPPPHVVLVRRAVGADGGGASLAAGAKAIVGSLHDAHAWASDPRLRGIDGIFHLAARVVHSRRAPGETYRTNVEGTLNMVRVAARLGVPMVYVSTSGTVGVFADATASADEYAPRCTHKVRRWPYYHSKALAEQAARALATQLNVRLTIVRPPMLLGPGDDRYRATSQIVRFLRGRMPFVLAGGVHYTDVRDAAGAMVAAMQHPAPQHVYNLPGRATGVGQFFAEVAEVAGRPAPRLCLPYALAWPLAVLGTWAQKGLGLPALLPDPVVIEMGSHFWGVHSRHAATDLRYAPRPYVQTLADTVAWIRAHRTDCGRPRSQPNS